jgi:hypothetical protein
MIPADGRPLRRGSIWLAAAAGIAAVMVIATWLRAPAPVLPAAPMDRAALTALAMEHPAAFDAALAEVSRASLPDVSERGGAFERLARESR